MFTYPILGSGPPSSLATVDYIVYQNAGTGTIAERSFNVATGAASLLKSTGSLSNEAFLVRDASFVFGAHATTLTQYAWNGSAFTARDTTTIVSANSARITETHPNRLWLPEQVAFGGEISMWSYTSAPTYSTVQLDITAVGILGRYMKRITDVRDTGEARGSRGSILACYSSNSGYRPMAVKSSDDTNIDTVGSADTNSPFAAATGCVDRHTGEMYASPSASTSVAIYEMDKSTCAITYIGVGNLSANVSDLVADRGFLVAYHTDSTVRSYSRSGTTFTEISSKSVGSSGGTLAISPYTECIYVAATSDSSVYRLSEAGALTKLGDSGLSTQTAAYNTIDFGTAPLATV